MNFARTIAAPALILAVGFGLAACQPDKPPGTTPPGDGGNGAAVDPEPSEGGGSEVAATDPGGGDEGAEAPSNELPKDCAAQIASVSVPLFGDRVLVKPPINVELVQEHEGLATTYASGGFVSACDATVDKMTILVFKNDKKKKLATYVDEVINDMLPKNGFAGGTRGKNHVETATDIHTDIEYPAANGAPPAQLYVAVTRKFDYVLVAVYQTRPPEFPVLLPSFRESAKSILVVPPDA